MGVRRQVRAAAGPRSRRLLPYPRSRAGRTQPRASIKRPAPPPPLPAVPQANNGTAGGRAAAARSGGGAPKASPPPPAS